MKHLDDTSILRLALGEAMAAEAGSMEAHAVGCAHCAERLDAARRAWTAMEADPAAALGERPVWPCVAEALEGAPRDAMPVLRPAWKIAAVEARRSPLAYAGASLVLAVLVAGHVGGRSLLGAALPAGDGSTGTQSGGVEGAQTEEGLLEYSALAGLPDGSLAALYLDDELGSAGASQDGSEP